MTPAPPRTAFAPTAIPPEAAPDALDARVLGERVAMLYATIRMATLGDALLAQSFGAVMYWQARRWEVLAWMLMHLYNTARMPVLTAWFKDPQASERAPHWARIYCRELRLNSLTWGLAPLLFLPDSLPLLSLMLMVILGLGAAGVSAVAPLKRATWNYLVPMIAGLMLGLLIRPSLVHAFLALACLIFLGSVLHFAQAQSAMIEQALRSRFEKEALAEQLAAQMRATEVASQQKTRFLASASHDLRQPLHAIALLSAALRKQLAGHDSESTAVHLAQAVGTLSHSLDTMLDVSRLDAGVIATERRAVALQELFQSLNVGFVNAASEKDINLRVRATTLWVHSDPQLLRRLLSNLIDNAIKYTRRGGVLVLARKRGGDVCIEVHDTGIGIAPEQQTRVYEEFYQVDNPARDRKLGLGIGLSIVARLSSLLGHPLELTSTPGRGTRFRLHLPLAQPPERLAPVLPQPLGATPIEALLPGRVLVLDDEPEVRFAMTELLRIHGIAALTSANEAEAEATLEAAQARGELFELLICDYRLAHGVDGLRVGQTLARRYAPMRLLLITGDTAPERLQAVHDSGVPVLFKPVDSEQLLGAIAQVSRQEAERASPQTVASGNDAT